MRLNEKVEGCLATLIAGVVVIGMAGLLCFGLASASIWLMGVFPAPAPLTAQSPVDDIIDDCGEKATDDDDFDRAAFVRCLNGFEYSVKR